MAETTTLKAITEAVMDDLGLLIDTVIDVVVDGDTLTINQLADKTPDAERMRNAYVYQAALWRRIVSFGYPSTNNVELARTGTFSAAAAQIYFLLDPDDTRKAINEALSQLFFEDKVTLAILADTRTYELASWIQQRGQVFKVNWRDISLLSTKPLEEEIPSYSIREDANVCTLYVNDVVQLKSPTTYDIQVYARRNYSKLASDAATTTCPYPLLFGVAKVAVMRKLFSKFGKVMGSQFGPKLAVAEREEVKLKSDWLPKLRAREYIEEENWHGPDLNPGFELPPW
jgi:hypothetical protein